MLRSSSHAAYTLLETLVAAVLGTVVGAILLEMMWNGAILFAKNSAINVAHQQARYAVMKMERELHGSASVPQLVDGSRNPVTGLGPSAGIAIQSFVGGPYKIAAGDYFTTQNQITIVGSSPAPQVNQRFNIETHNVESYITAVTPSGSNYVITLADTLANEVNTTLNSQAVNISAFTTQQTAYVVIGTQLRRYGAHNSSAYTILANDITSPTPFSTPQSAAGAPYNRFVAAINLICADPAASNLNFVAANMYLNSMVPYRYRLTQTQ